MAKERTWKPGAKTIQALEIIRDTEPNNARAFAMRMWPDSDGWQVLSNQGRGSGMWKAGGSFLGRLRARGLIRGYGGYRSIFYLTYEGEQVLADWERERLL